MEYPTRILVEVLEQRKQLVYVSDGYSKRSDISLIGDSDYVTTI